MCPFSLKWFKIICLPCLPQNIINSEIDDISNVSYKLKHRRFSPNIKKNIFPVGVTKHRQRLPRDPVESPSLEIFKSHLDMVLGSLLWVTLLEQGAGQDDLQRCLPTSAILDSVNTYL